MKEESPNISRKSTLISFVKNAQDYIKAYAKKCRHSYLRMLST